MKELNNAIHCAEKFQLHPLGFFYLQDKVGGGITHRVHVWLPDGADRLENDRHSHSYDIESLVVVGKMHSELFQFRHTADGANLEFAVSYQSGKSILQPTGKRGVLDAVASFETSSGARYFLNAGVIHRVTVTKVPCVTVLTTSERGKPIYSYGIAEEEEPFNRRAANQDEIHKIKTTLKGALQ